MNLELLGDYVRDPLMMPNRIRYFEHVFGLVEDNKDPLKLGRLRIRTSVHSEAPTEQLPWAHYVSPSGGSKDAGYYFIPPIGGQVLCGFVGGDPTYPLWFGTVWGCPDDVSEAYVASIDDTDPYSQGEGEDWDYTQIQSITTPAGIRILLDDNLTHPDDVNTAMAVNYRRVVIDTPGGFYFSMREDKQLQRTDTEEFHGVLEMGTREGRTFVLDDSDETIKLAAPDNFSFELNSRDDFVHLETEIGQVLHFDATSTNTIDLYTPGASTDRGHRLFFDEPNNQILLKSAGGRFFLEISDIPGGHQGLYSHHGATIEISDTSNNDGYHSLLAYTASPGSSGVAPRDNIGWHIDPGDGGGIRTAAYFYVGPYRNPTHMIRLTNDGLVLLGTSNGTTAAITLDTRVGGDGTFTSRRDMIITAQRNISLRALGSFPSPADAIELSGPFVSKYFRHRHAVSLMSPINLALGLTSPLGMSTRLFVLDPISGPLFLQTITPGVAELYTSRPDQTVEAQGPP